MKNKMIKLYLVLIKGCEHIDNVPILGTILYAIGQALVLVLYYALYPIGRLLRYFKEYNEFILHGDDGSIIHADNIQIASELSSLSIKTLKLLKQYRHDNIPAFRGDNGVHYILHESIDWDDFWTNLEPREYFALPIRLKPKVKKLIEDSLQLRNGEMVNSFTTAYDGKGIAS